MQTVQQAIADVLNARERDLVDLYEIYDHFYEPGAGGFDPSQALLRLTSVSGVTWNNHSYRRQSVGRSDIDRSMGPTFNSVSFKLTNVDRFMAAFILTHDIEGMRLVVRTVSKGTPANSTASVVIFTGRLDKPGEIDKRTCPMSAKQDLASVQHVVPWREFEQSCPLVFKGPDCLGTETLAEKSAEYQAATTCDHARDGDCARFANTKFFQGFRFNPISGTFRYQTTETKRFLLFFTKKKTVWRDGQWSSEDLTPYGHKVSFALGRVQAPLVPIEIADHGDSLRFRGAIGEGPLDAITNVKNQSGGPSPTSLTTHLGEYGGEGTQTADPLFPNSDLYSRTANVTGLVGGGSFTAKDPMPDITVTARGMRAPLPDAGGVFNQTGWTDNPAYLTRYVLTDPRLFNISPNLIDDAVCFDTAKFCDEPLIDDSNGERLFVPAAQASEFGTGPEQARRFRSTGLLDSRWYRYHLGLAAELPEFIAATRSTRFSQTRRRPLTFFSKSYCRPSVAISPSTRRGSSRFAASDP
ncbi:MAG: hypothetical protein AUG51_19430 [Acidobacteria bacterium 13_1_20CM_3_53_8]|nr:MAG: hypothetical protein AUG51_19430 [Acidobacteria bacterium 13_1_20CM_3_53_8]